MIIRRIIIELFLKLGFHRWEYSSKIITQGTSRYCRWCGKKQIYLNDSSSSGIGGEFRKWVDIGNEFEFNNNINITLPANERIKQAPYSIWIPAERFAEVKAILKPGQSEDITFETIDEVKYRIHKIYTDAGTQETVKLEE
jgi:hypothetical protein